MTTIQLEAHIKEQFNMGLYEFIKQKVEKENLYDYELAGILNVDRALIGKLKKVFIIEKAAGFPRRFEQTYGAGAVERFKKIIENPDSTLVDVAGHFGFSREYARQVYKKIYGYPYTEAFQNKLLARKRKARANREKPKRLDLLIKIKEKMESLGLTLHLRIRKHSYEILTNGYRLLVRHALTTVTIGKKQYFHITTGTGSADIDFIICLCRNNGKTIHYVIPRHVMPKYGVYLSPEAGTGGSKYARFKEAWYLLKHENRIKEVS
ncbi:MAG: helix-turn-helix transcriptional regulator [Thermodesulfobacteriota bacterium]|nr:helix-turn-helix transcriptional regulator [Thermodesulfobacteriota bacterium]